MAGKSYEKEVALYAFLGELERNANQAITDLARRLRESLWEVLHVAITPPGSWQEELIRTSALTDLEKGNTFNYCISEVEKFALEHPLLASTLNILERVVNVKALS